MKAFFQKNIYIKTSSLYDYILKSKLEFIMPLIKPLTPFLANKENIDSLIAPPYDIVNHEQVQSYMHIKPNSIMNVTRADGQFDEPQNILPEKVYQAALESLKEIQANRYQKHSKPCFLIYQIKGASSCQTGLLCLADTKHLKKHELTRPAKVKDRMSLSKTIDCQISPVMLCTDSKEKFSKQIAEQLLTSKILYETEYNNYQHLVFLIEQDEDITRLQQYFNHDKRIYIADGHHRSQTQLELHQIDPMTYSSYALSVIFPGEELNILGYHRIVKRPQNLSVNKLWAALETDFSIEKSSTAILPTNKNTFGCYVNQQWYILNYKDLNNSLLPIEILHNNIIEPLFKITNPREDNNIDFIGGDDATKQIEQRINKQTDWLGFTIAPTTVEQIINTANKNQVMPPKSTYFEPKLLDGFILQSESK